MDFSQMRVGDMGIDLSCADILVAEHRLHAT